MNDGSARERSRALRDPVAVVGIGCRFPLGSNAEEYWKGLQRGLDAVREIPSSRWKIDDYYDPDPKTPGKMHVRRGAFIDDVDEVDWNALAISPREAIQMDPQQRLVLEVAWEALEDAGVPVDSLRGTSAGVFIGVFRSDYETLLLRDPAAGDPYSMPGIALAFTANRLSHLLECTGPSMAVEVGCSSSLVAVHYAARSIWSGDCDVALAGGVMLNLVPEHFVRFSKSGFLSPNGRCATFDAEADGFVPGEGVGVVVLKSLERARRDGDHIYALVRGSSFTHNGSNAWIMQTSQRGQEDLLRSALRDAGAEPDDVDFVEMHGTGTKIGDPVEAAALGAVFGRDRAPDRKLLVGSVKTNMGHLQAASGIAHFIKAALALERGEIPPSLHLRTLNPKIKPEWNLECPQETRPWPKKSGPRLAGVTSLSLGGANAHVVLEQPPAPVDAARGDAPSSSGPHLLPLSAKTEQALRGLALRYANALDAGAGTPRLEDVCFSAGTTRAHHGKRAALVAADRGEMVRALRELAAGKSVEGVASGSCDTDVVPKIAFVFPGQGGEWLGMGRGLLDAHEGFRQAIEECDAIVRREVGWSVLDELRASQESSKLADIDVAQPLLFSVQVGLAAVWRSFGIEPHAVVGHSMGELAAACTSGALSLDDAARVICTRSRLMRRLTGKGGMAVVDLSLEEAEREIAPFRAEISIAAQNSPRATVLAGAPGALQSIVAGFEARGVFCRTLRLSIASHCPLVDPLLDELVAALGEVRPRESRVPLYSTVLARALQGEPLDAAYWKANLRQPVRLVEAVRAMLDDGFTHFVEMSPHPTLIAALQENFAAHAGDRGAAAVPSLRRERDDVRSIHEGLGLLYAQGGRLDWRLVAPGGKRTRLPKYAWQRSKLWLPEPDVTAPRAGPGGGASHPLLGERISLPHARDQHVWSTIVKQRSHPWLADHLVQGAVLFPGTAFLQLAQAAGEAIFSDPFAIEDVAFEQPLLVEKDDAAVIQVAVTMEGSREASFAIHGRDPRSADAPWIAHARGRLVAAVPEERGARSGAGPVRANAALVGA